MDAASSEADCRANCRADAKCPSFLWVAGECRRHMAHATGTTVNAWAKVWRAKLGQRLSEWMCVTGPQFVFTLDSLLPVSYQCLKSRTSQSTHFAVQDDIGNLLPGVWMELASVTFTSVPRCLTPNAEASFIIVQSPKEPLQPLTFVEAYSGSTFTESATTAYPGFPPPPPPIARSRTARRRRRAWRCPAAAGTPRGSSAR